MTWWNRLRHRGKLEEQLEKELAFHLEQHIADLMARGLPPGEARRQARMALGGLEQVKEGCRDVPTLVFFLFTRGGETVVIETAGDPAAMADSVRKTFREAVPGVTRHSLVTLRQQMSLAFFLWQAAAGLLGISAILGIFLSGVGLYGVVSHGVTRRTHEIGVRIAMGARPLL